MSTMDKSGKQSANAYCIFDSARQYFEEKIQSREEQPLGFLLDAKCIGCSSVPNCSTCQYRLWRLGIVYKSEWEECPSIFDVLKKSRRTITIGNKQYPVAHLGLDDAFFDASKKHSLKSGSWLSCFRRCPTLILDMSMHQYFIGPGPIEDSVLHH